MYFSDKQYKSGIEEVTGDAGKFRIYNAEKTICDIFRYRNKLGIDTAKQALKEYIKRKDADYSKLLNFAGICRVKPVIRTWLDVLI